MSPSLTTNDILNQFSIDAVRFSETSLAKKTRGVTFPNHFHNIASKFMAWMAFAVKNPFNTIWCPIVSSFRLTSFSHAILLVIFLSSDPKMIRIHTSGIISTGTIMANAQTIWNNPEFQEPGKSMSEPFKAFLSHPELKPGITVIGYFGIPNPTFLCFFNVTPKLFDDVWGIHHSRPRNDVLIHIASSEDRFLLGSGLCASNYTKYNS